MTTRCVKCGEPLLGAVNRCWRCGMEILDAMAAEPPSSSESASSTASWPARAVRFFRRERPARRAHPAAMACVWAGLALGAAAFATSGTSSISAATLGLCGLVLSLCGFSSGRRVLATLATLLCLLALTISTVPALAEAYELIYGEPLFAPRNADEIGEFEEIVP